MLKFYTIRLFNYKEICTYIFIFILDGDFMDKQSNKRNSFASSIGFVLAAAGSAVGLGNIWRFPYLAAKDGGGTFLLVYIILALTFGFTLLITEISVGRKTKQSPLTAYGKLHEKWNWLGVIACLVPIIIMPYYTVIGGWVVKYFFAFMTGGSALAAQDGYFTNFITAQYEPIIMMFIFLAICSIVVYRGVNKGIESLSKVLMPLLLIFIIIIAIFSITISYTDADGVTRTGLQGLGVLLIPNFDGMTLSKFLGILVDAMGQLFFSLSVAMGIMITYGSYMQDNDNLNRSINQIEIFDTFVAILAGVMIIPAVYAFAGTEGMEASGPGLMFITMPKVFAEMGSMGAFFGFLFFAMIFFAALTSAISIMEAVVSSLMDRFNISRSKATLLEFAVAMIVGVIVCLGYNLLYFELTLPNGAVAQVLDVMDYLSNNILMPIVALGTCVLIGWVLSPKDIIDEVEKSGVKMGRKNLYNIMIKFIAPLMLLILFIQSLGIFAF